VDGGCQRHIASWARIGHNHCLGDGGHSHFLRFGCNTSAITAFLAAASAAAAAQAAKRGEGEQSQRKEEQGPIDLVPARSRRRRHHAVGLVSGGCGDIVLAFMVIGPLLCDGVAAGSGERGKVIQEALAGIRDSASGLRLLSM